jgi:hypothetical protein
MADGIVSDTTDERVMDSAEATVTIDPESLLPEQVSALLQQVGVDRAQAYYVGKIVQGHDVRDEMDDIEVHLTTDEALSALAAVGVVDSRGPAEVSDDGQ